MTFNYDVNVAIYHDVNDAVKDLNDSCNIYVYDASNSSANDAVSIKKHH